MSFSGDQKVEKIKVEKKLNLKQFGFKIEPTISIGEAVPIIWPKSTFGCQIMEMTILIFPTTIGLALTQSRPGSKFNVASPEVEQTKQRAHVFSFL